MKSFQTEAIFILDSLNAFDLAERFKAKLENKGLERLDSKKSNNAYSDFMNNCFLKADSRGQLVIINRLLTAFNQMRCKK